MYKITEKKKLNDFVVKMEIEAPLVARKARPGQFIILRVDENSERIPLTIAGYDRNAGTVSIIFQIVGATTYSLSLKEAGDDICDFAGPLGNPTNTEDINSVCIVAGGVGTAIALPVAKEFYDIGTEVDTIVGFRTKELVILEDEFRSCSNSFSIVTDDGSYGDKGNVTMCLKQKLESGKKYDIIITIGPLIMMKFVVLTAKPFDIPVSVSMNSIMIDGTGMCGGCRLTLLQNGKRITKFACVDGPEFNGYEIDFDEAMNRSHFYSDFEKHAYDKACNLFGKGDNI